MAIFSFTAPKKSLYERLREGASKSEVPQYAFIKDTATGVELFIDIRVSESHGLQAELAEQVLENGARVSDHVILKPRALALVYEQTNFHRFPTPKATEAWESLRKMWQSRAVLIVITQHEAYSNMVIEQVGAIHRAPNKGAIQFTINLKQVNYAGVGMVDVPASALKGDVSKTAATEKNAGTQQPKQVRQETALSSWFGGLFK